MGTSTNYSAPPSWGPLKSEVTKKAKDNPGQQEAQELLQSFIQKNGGVTSFARGSGGGGGAGGGGSGGGETTAGGRTGGGARVASGRSARTTAVRLGAFLSDVRSSGLEGALKKAGWGDLVGKPVSEFLACLLDRIGDSSSSIDGVDARMALLALEKQYFGEAETSQQLEEKLTEQVQHIEPILQDYFGHYLYEVFCRVFYEHLVQRVGDTKAESLLGQIKTFISASIKNLASTEDISKIEWGSKDGDRVVADIMETTLNVFG